LFIDDFFADIAVTPSDLPVVLVNIREPHLGPEEPSTGAIPAIAFRFPIPHSYTPGNDITMRFFFHRTGPMADDCLYFSIDGRRLRSGHDIENYGQTRYVNLMIPASMLDEQTGAVSMTVDVPVNEEVGLGLPDDLEPGDLVAFELRTVSNANGTEQLLGVEIYESAPGTSTLAGVTVHSGIDSVNCEQPG
jgi:hypothetical protein